MKLFSPFALSALLLIGCQEPQSQSDTKNPSPASQEESENMDYFGFDTLLLKEYTSYNGHQIKLEGSKSKDLYRISVRTREGLSKQFQIAEDHYTASHSKIVWDNDDFLFVHFSCGTNCWGARVLPLDFKNEPKTFMQYLYQDSIHNIIVYPDISDPKRLCIETFEHKQRYSMVLDLCGDPINPMGAVRCYTKDEKNILIIEYPGPDCLELISETVNLDEVLNLSSS